MFKQPNPLACCLNMFFFFFFENPQDGPRFVCMTLCGKTLWPGISILSAFIDIIVVRGNDVTDVRFCY